ncbi:hypothetical protein P4O66_007136 [Electrophorus voltai]|uniref:Uncharacterized protein n=1 Tax=Electrophorus voltai TaxID=2609070 RepID=A0AAD8ZG78_9TELE|nr:hypothetical protein P4O66_007136 [Electrophorus voltai]
MESRAAFVGFDRLLCTDDGVSHLCACTLWLVSVSQTAGRGQTAGEHRVLQILSRTDPSHSKELHQTSVEHSPVPGKTGHDSPGGWLGKCRRGLSQAQLSDRSLQVRINPDLLTQDPSMDPRATTEPYRHEDGAGGGTRSSSGPRHLRNRGKATGSGAGQGPSQTRRLLITLKRLELQGVVERGWVERRTPASRP